MRTLALALVAFTACGGGKSAEADVKEPTAPGGKSPATMTMTSPAFGANEDIPSEYTCEGGDTSPPLAWDGVPADAKALALIVDDPDAPDPAAPKRTWVHWVAVLPANSRTLPAGAAARMPEGATVGKNDWGKAGYGGPCPPVGKHRYFFKLYALDLSLDASGLDKAALIGRIDGHVLAKGELIGRYQKRR